MAAGVCRLLNTGCALLRGYFPAVRDALALKGECFGGFPDRDLPLTAEPGGLTPQRERLLDGLKALARTCS